MISFIGACVNNLVQSFKYVVKGNLKWNAVVNQAALTCFESLPIALTIVIISAAVIALQVSKQFLMSGGESYVGGSIAIALIREIAPGFAALAISARAGTAICAEIANMQVTEQVDAIKTLKVDPIGYYFAPRIIAAAIFVPLVVVLAEFLGVMAGMGVAYFSIDLYPTRYLHTVWLWVNTKDIYISLFKAMIFGVLLTDVCATQGYLTKGGAKDVGTSTIKSAIYATIVLLVADLILNIIFYL